jgi:hypothetical protein
MSALNAVYDSSYSIEQNRRFLQDLKNQYESSPAGFCVAETPANRVLGARNIYTYDYRTQEEQSEEELITEIFSNLFHISFERETDITHPKLTFGRGEIKLSELVAERLHNSILIVLNPQPINHREVMVPQPSSIPSIKKAFVPQSLTGLFRSIFPDVDVVSVPSYLLTITLEISAATQEERETFESLGFINHQFTITCPTPNYEEVIRRYLKEHTQSASHIQHSLLFQNIRLVAPTDESLKEEKADRIEGVKPVSAPQAEPIENLPPQVQNQNDHHIDIILPADHLASELPETRTTGQKLHDLVFACFRSMSSCCKKQKYI